MAPTCRANKAAPLTVNSYLTSPIVELVVGHGDNETVLMAHQNLLLESPFLAESISNFNESGPVCRALPPQSYKHNADII